ncbi:protein-glutamate methylesterase/protein-glutamine glutaminase [Pleionea sediminis]|uniref:protein-glutamate methylesterase/protein-glutamine glutaminase n=1 Tax=Pleionea sediminis TaxID=2569479 RepID=UPI001185CC71|nr:chemotaxis response regulator protein-glutamate methylesterase [Pleionea sediminis]
MKKIRVLIVDDSALIRLLLSEILSQDKSINIVGTASDPYEAREKIKKTHPDVITLDVEMPRMDGLTFLSNLMRLRPMPVVMISTLTQKGADVTLRALELGAFDFVCKPSTQIKETLTEYSQEIIEKVKAAAHSNISSAALTIPNKPTAAIKQQSQQFELIAIGASTGGTEAIKNVVSALPTGLPPIVIAQHIPDVFSTSYAKRLDSLTELTVLEVRSTQELKQSHVYIAPGDDHLLVTKRQGKLFGSIEKTELVNRHRPSVDVLFDSVVKATGKKTLGIILTGMGADGAAGLKNIKLAGGITLAQDEASSVVWGMPGAAVKMDAATKVLPLQKIPQAIVRFISSD